MKIITFGGMHPNYTNYKEELLRLKQAGIPGIKLHPAYQNVDLDDIRMMRIIDEASSQGLITLVHAGIDIGIYDHNYSCCSDFKIIKRSCPGEAGSCTYGKLGLLERSRE
jgi:predicted TIM-barrel fold metal-dependent hydrolase